MKKLFRIILISISCNVITPVYGQLSTIQKATPINLFHTTSGVKSVNVLGGPGVFLGIRYMPTITSLDYKHLGNSTVETSATFGYGIGGVVGVNITDHFGLQAELIYSQLAQQYKRDAFANEIKLNYVNIPLLISLNTGASAPVNFNFVFGPQFGVNTGSSISSGKNESGSDTLNAKLAVKKSDVGIAYGAGLDFGLGSAVRLGVGFRGVYGLIDISVESQTITTQDYYVLDRTHIKTYSGYIGLTIGF